MYNNITLLLLLCAILLSRLGIVLSFSRSHVYGVSKITNVNEKRFNVIGTNIVLSASGNQNGYVTSEDDVVALVHSHHLLDHKPDNMILKGSKYKLRGVACLGRPGVALCIGPLKSIDKFRSKLKSTMPQKKFGTIVIDDVPSDELVKIEGFEAATLGELRSLLAALGNEDSFFTLTGIDPSNASNPSSKATEERKGGKKAGKRKRK